MLDVRDRMKWLMGTRAVADYLHKADCPSLQQKTVAVIESTLLCAPLEDYIKHIHVYGMQVEKTAIERDELADKSSLQAFRFEWTVVSGLVKCLQSNNCMTILSALRSLKHLTLLDGGTMYLHKVHTHLKAELNDLSTSAAVNSAPSSASSSSLKSSCSAGMLSVNQVLDMAKSMSLKLKVSGTTTPKSILIHLSLLILKYIPEKDLVHTSQESYSTVYNSNALLGFTIVENCHHSTSPIHSPEKPQDALQMGGIVYEAFTLLFSLSTLFSTDELSLKLHNDLGSFSLGYECASMVSNAARQVILVSGWLGVSSLVRCARKLEQRAQLLR